MNLRRITRNTLLAIAAGLLPGMAAQAVPTLQLYVEGSTYDPTHESWVFQAALDTTFTLWVLGDVESSGTITDVKLSVVYPDIVAGDGGSLDVQITPTQAGASGIGGATLGSFGGFTDPSTAGPVSGPTQVSEAGDAPTLFNGNPLAPHGVYIAGNEWQEFALGDFTLTDSPIADFISTFPDAASAPASGQISAYDITVSLAAHIDPATVSLDPFDLHFDAYDHVVAGNHIKSVFAPFSHDAGTGINEPLPEPATLALIGLGLAGIGARRLRKT